MSDYRTTAYCRGPHRQQGHGLQQIVTVASWLPIKQGGIHLTGTLACGCRFGCVASSENATTIAAKCRR